MNAIASIATAIILGFCAMQLLAVPTQVWFGDQTGSCIVIIDPDGTERPCPEDKSELPDNYEPIYVFEETDHE